MRKNAPLTKIVLCTIAGINQAVITFEILWTIFSYDKALKAAMSRGGISEYYRIKNLRYQKILRQKIRELKRAKLIATRQAGRRLIISLTQKGITQTMAYRLRQAKQNKKGFYTIVIFDIPESQKHARAQFRLLLKAGGFIKLQQSVWISRGDTKKIIGNFIKRIKIEHWVNVFDSTNFLYLPDQLKTQNSAR